MPSLGQAPSHSKHHSRAAPAGHHSSAARIGSRMPTESRPQRKQHGRGEKRTMHSSRPAWTHVDPTGTYSATRGWVEPVDDATTDPGRFCWITGADAAVTGTTTLVSPLFDLSGTTWATVGYRRWFQTSSTGKLDVNVRQGESGHLRAPARSVYSRARPREVRDYAEFFHRLLPFTLRIELLPLRE